MIIYNILFLAYVSKLLIYFFKSSITVFKSAFTQLFYIQFSSVQLLSHVQLFATPWTAACQASLSITNSWSLPRLMSIESVMPSNHFILWCRLILLPSIFPSIRVFSNESVLHIRWPKYCSFSFNTIQFNTIRNLIIPLWCESAGSTSHGGELLSSNL